MSKGWGRLNNNMTAPPSVLLIHQQQGSKAGAAQIAGKRNRPREGGASQIKSHRWKSATLANLAVILLSGIDWSLHCVDCKACNKTFAAVAWCEQCKMVQYRVGNRWWEESAECSSRSRLAWSPNNAFQPSAHYSTVLSRSELTRSRNSVFKWIFLANISLCCLRPANPFVDLHLESRCLAEQWKRYILLLITMVLQTYYVLKGSCPGGQCCPTKNEDDYWFSNLKFD